MIGYQSPSDLKEALEVLAQPEVRIIAGGTDLMVQLRESRGRGEEPPGTLLDVTRIPELKRLDLESEKPFVGAAVTFRTLETDPRVAQTYPLLAQAAGTVGSVQIRQTGTLGGNAGNGSPSADGVAALTALGAVAEIVSPRGTRLCLLEELITGPNRTRLAPEELITGFYLDRLEPGTVQLFAKVGRRRAVAVSRLNVSVCLNRDLNQARLVLGACFPSPRRLKVVEELLAQGDPGPGLWTKAGQTASAEFVNVCGIRTSAAYKLPAIEKMVARTLEQAWSLVENGPEVAS